jgi:GT2 family glycosyltransferase
MKKITLDIIIVNYNASFWLKLTLSTLKDFFLNSTKYQTKVIMVDNNSSDDSVEMVRQNFPDVQISVLAENKGYAFANNHALRQSQADYVLLLNSDMELTQESHFDSIIEFAQSHPKVAVVTPQVIFSNGQLDPACHRGEPDLWTSFTYFSKLEKLFPQSRWFGKYHQGYKDLTTIHTIDACSGAAMLIKRTVLEKVGLFDERFFMYAEDLDLCKRIRENEYHIVYHPGCRIIHHKYKSGIRGSTKQIAKSTKFHFYDTMLQYYDKHYRTKYPELVRKVVNLVLSIKKGAL